MAGVALETNGGEGSKGSHWERILLQDEIMTASSISGESVFSIFTMALLDDTNWYNSIDYSLAPPIQWGNGKGCDFTTKACLSATSFS